MVRVAMEGFGNVNEVVEVIKNQILKGALSADLTSEVFRGEEGSETILLVFEKYFMRVSSRASLSVLILNNNGDITVDSIGGGAGQGPVFKMAFRAEEDFAESVIAPLEKLGFVRK